MNYGLWWFGHLTPIPHHPEVMNGCEFAWELRNQSAERQHVLIKNNEDWEDCLTPCTGYFRSRESRDESARLTREAWIQACGLWIQSKLMREKWFRIKVRVRLVSVGVSGDTWGSRCPLSLGPSLETKVRSQAVFSGM